MTEPARELEVTHPVHRIRIPVAPDLVALTFTDAEDLTQPTFRIVDYDLVTGPLGPPSRDDQGRLRYQLQRP